MIGHRALRKSPILPVRSTYENKDAARNLAQDCVWEAQTRGITKTDLIEAAGGDLEAYILAELNRTVDKEVEDTIVQGVR